MASESMALAGAWRLGKAGPGGCERLRLDALGRTGRKWGVSGSGDHRTPW